MYEIVEAHILLALSVVHIKTPDAVMISGGIRGEIRAARGYADAQGEGDSLINETVINSSGKNSAHSAADINNTGHALPRTH